MKKTVIKRVKARKKFKKGIDLVADVVKLTLGAKGRNVMCIRPQMLPVITKDGVSIAKEIESEDPIVNAGASAVKQVAGKTNEGAADGTTTSTVLAQALVNEAYKLLEDSVNTISLKRGIDKACEIAVKLLAERAVKSKSISTIRNIANISANGDKEVTDLIVEAIKKVGTNGLLKVEDSANISSYVEVQEGYEFDSPYSSYLYITDANKLTAEFEDMRVLLYEGHIDDFSKLTNVIQQCTIEDKFLGLLIVANSMDNKLEANIQDFKLQGFKIMYVTSPAFNVRRSEILQDIAALIGTTVFKEGLENIELSELGHVEKVISDENKTTLIGGSADKTLLKERIEVVEQQISAVKAKKEKEFYKERLSKLSNKLAVIRVGANSEVERREKSDRVDDAVGAVKACIEKGYLPGEGTAYIQVSKEIKDKVTTVNPDEDKGVDVLISALSYPFNQILENAGIEFEGELEEGEGICLNSGNKIDLKKEGIIDPAKVSILALQNAVSIVGTFLTTDAIVYNNEGIFKQ